MHPCNNAIQSSRPGLSSKLIAPGPFKIPVPKRDGAADVVFDSPDALRNRTLYAFGNRLMTRDTNC